MSSPPEANPPMAVNSRLPPRKILQAMLSRLFTSGTSVSSLSVSATHACNAFRSHGRCMFPELNQPLAASVPYRRPNCLIFLHVICSYTLDHINPKLNAKSNSSSGIPTIRIPEIAERFHTCPTYPGYKRMSVRKYTKYTPKKRPALMSIFTLRSGRQYHVATPPTIKAKTEI